MKTKQILYDNISEIRCICIENLQNKFGGVLGSVENESERTGAAIPNVSDIDLANTEIYVPFNSEKEIISNQIKKAFDLMQEFKNQLENITLEVN